MWLLFILGALSALYFFARRTYSYWERRGVPHLPYVIPFGHVTKLANSRQLISFVKPTYEHFKNAKVPFVGLYFFHRPFAVIIQPELLRHVLIKDFDHFQDRGLYHNASSDPLSAHLFTMGGEPWRKMRSKLTPTFTSGKMKFMYPTMLEVAKHFEENLAGLVDATGTDSIVLELKDLLARFTTDIIGTCAFGIECNSLADPDAEFRQMGRAIFAKTRHGPLGSVFINSFPQLALWLNMKVVPDPISDFFLKVVAETIEYREKNGISRNDFLDLLIELKNAPVKDGDEALTVGVIAAQVFVFFLAGFETSSTTMMFALYELALNPDVQQRAREEIETALARHGGLFNYEAMMEMRYLDNVITETLRKYPPLGTLIRSATKDYAVPGTTQTIAKGTKILIPAYAIQHDEQHYADPERFDPDRFDANARNELDPVTFLAFGQGPRNCIGSRFGMMQSRIGLATLLKHYTIGRAAQTQVPLEFSTKGFLLNVDGGMWLQLTKLTTTATKN